MSHFSFFSLVACCIYLCLDIFNHWICVVFAMMFHFELIFLVFWFDGVFVCVDVAVVAVHSRCTGHFPSFSANLHAHLEYTSSITRAHLFFFISTNFNSYQQLVAVFSFLFTFVIIIYMRIQWVDKHRKLKKATFLIWCSFYVYMPSAIVRMLAP